MAQTEIKVNDTQKRLLEEAGKKVNELNNQRNIITEMLNQAANGADSLLTVICDAHGVEALPGTKYNKGIISIPQPEKRADRRKKEKAETEKK